MTVSNSTKVTLSILLTLLTTCSTAILNCSSTDPCTESIYICNHKEPCIIQCIGNGVCSNSQFICSPINDCTLICDSKGSHTSPCKNVQLIAQNTTNTSINIICNNISPCDNLSINASNVSNINFISNQTGAITTISDTNIFVIHAEFITNSLNIICNGENTCYKSIIYANYSFNINIITNGANTLSNTKIYAYYASSFKLSCNSMHQIGCNYPSLYLPILSTSYIELNCTGLGCKNLILYSQNGFTDIDMLHLDGCNSCKNIGGDTLDSCIYLWTMHCNTHYTHSTSLWGSYCDNSNCGCMDYGLPLIENAWQNTNTLCNAYNTTITCDNGLHCDINCSLYHCSNGLINALTAKSVNIICESDSDCDSLIVYCPSNQNTQCNLICGTDHSCNQALVYGINGDNINIYCNSWYSCHSMEIHAYNANNISLLCENSNACHHLTLFGTNSDYISIICDYSTSQYIDSPCYSATIYGENANKLELQCKSNYSCCNNYVFAQNAETLLITAYGDHALYAPYIYAQDSNNFTLSCIGYNKHIVCQQLELYIERSETNINCIGLGCETLTIYDNNIHNDINMITVIGDCDSCNDSHSCIFQWDIKCSATKQDYFDGVVCESNNCDCNYLQNKIKNGWKYKDNKCSHKKKDNGLFSTWWIVVICIIISLLIIFIIIVSIYTLCNRKKSKIKVVNKSEPVSPVIDLQNVSNSELTKTSKSGYKKMIDHMEIHNQEEVK